ncbi:MAG: type II toxin-antitoxin system VapC family toxin [Acidimicrobiia bacterium]
MIAYFDTSAFVPLFIDEPTSDACDRLWDDATRVLSVRLLYPEARAALARAWRMGRLTADAHAEAVALLDARMPEIDRIEVTEKLAGAAGAIAQHHALRGYDAVHLAAALTAADDDFVFVTGGQDLAAAARAVGLAVAIPAR